jgi:hypothetical protein
VATGAILRGTQLRVRWELLRERAAKSVGGAAEARPTTVRLTEPRETVNAAEVRLEFSAPEEAGPYRIYVYVYVSGGQVATANFPFWVE